MKQICGCLFAGAVGCAMGLYAPAARAATESVVYSFCSQTDCTDGEYPWASVVDLSGTLYGTTVYGGAYDGGTVFSLDPSTGAETILYPFCRKGGCTDGAEPYAGLLDVKGTLYGTTRIGGANGPGTVFALDPKTGVETVLHSFGSGTDGAYPYAGVIDVKGTLYGTTWEGGGNDAGTVFALDLKTGKEKVLYSFGGGGDGGYPEAGLIHVKDTFYGTTPSGGANGDGTVFAIDLKTGAETVLYSFCAQQNCMDGADPIAALINVSGVLYGTTYTGGINGDGTVFSLNPKTGVETVLYSFCSQGKCIDGANPFAGLIDVSGTLYGTTKFGGANKRGTVFALDLSTDAQTVLYSFCSQKKCTDGRTPYASLLNVNGTLYGTTEVGGANCEGNGDSGCGTVFSVTP